MLAKQLWLLITKPHSLVARVLKAKYYPSSSPLEARVGNRPSLTWRSIIGTKNIILAGHRLRIGSGQNVRIWKDQWIPRPITFKPITPPPNRLDNAVVAALIDPKTCEWDRLIIDGLFAPSDKDSILGIPLGRTNQPDLPC
ncbi:UNVERIFIED_CONTAM: hypothetical protein Slati_1711700 [Sesamum latifolium]|uniref:Uncharacterized protein n=1 Tax=Sesamum latifolium TaxID=2727402 RepID=A0AAW2WWM8_9LAMI